MKYEKIKLITSLLLLSSSGAQACGISDANSHTRQGMLYANMNDYGNAVNEFKASVDCQPNPAAYANLGATYLQQGKRNLALDALKKAEQRNQYDSVVMYNIAATHSLNDDTDLALEYLGRALENGFNNYDAIRFDSDLSNLRGEPEFRRVLEKHRVFIQ